MNTVNLERDHSDDENPQARQPPDELGLTISLLRARTASAHRHMESELQIVNRLSKSDSRSFLIEGYFTLHREVENAARPHLWNVQDLAFDSRIRSHQILSEAGSHGRRAQFVKISSPALQTIAEAFGALYVLEGSTLGGKQILRTLRSQSVSSDGLHFLNPYGKKTGAYWLSFLKVLERETGNHQSTMDQCVLGAMKTFSFAAQCLRAERKNEA